MFTDCFKGLIHYVESCRPTGGRQRVKRSSNSVWLIKMTFDLSDVVLWGGFKSSSQTLFIMDMINNPNITNRPLKWHFKRLICSTCQVEQWQSWSSGVQYVKYTQESIFTHLIVLFCPCLLQISRLKTKINILFIMWHWGIKLPNVAVKSSAEHDHEEKNVSRRSSLN